MSSQATDLATVVATLRDEDHLTEDQVAVADNVIEELAGIQPWYIRAMVAFGAWLASWLLIGFVAGIGFHSEIAAIFIGFFLIGGAVFVRRKSANDFVVQCTLACSLAGQGLAAFGVAQMSGFSFEGLMFLVIVINLVLLFVFPDRLHRVLSVLFITSSIAALLLKWRQFDLIPFLGPALAASLVIIYVQQATLMRRGMGELVRPLMTGLMLSAFGCLMLSTIYIIPELIEDFLIYPRPWISTLLLGAIFIYLGTRVWHQFLNPTNRQARYTFFALMAAIVAAAWAVPGLLLALIVIMLGAASGNRSFIGTGIGFLVVFLTAYFYGIQVTMMVKSMTLVATGVVILIARWQLLRSIDGVSANA